MPHDIIPYDADQPGIRHELTRKRAEIGGRIEHIQLELRRLLAEPGSPADGQRQSSTQRRPNGSLGPSSNPTLGGWHRLP